MHGGLLKKPASDLEASLIQQPTDPQSHGLLLPVEGGLLGGDPVDFLLGDDPGGQGFQIDLPQVHGTDLQTHRWYGQPTPKQGGFPNPTRTGPPSRGGPPNLSIRLRFWGCQNAVYENHPVFQSLEAQLQALRDQYRAQPSEQSRYALVRHEQLLAEWAPLAFSGMKNQM